MQKTWITLLLTLSLLIFPATVRADTSLPTTITWVQGSPIRVDGCSASRGYDENGVDSDFYLYANATFMNVSRVPATLVYIAVHFQGAYGDHDGLIIKRGTFSPQVEIEPKRNAVVGILGTANIDVDGLREIDIYGTVGAQCAAVAARFADGTVWNPYNLK